MPNPILTLISEQEKSFDELWPTLFKYNSDWNLIMGKIKSFHLASIRAIIKAVGERVNEMELESCGDDGIAGGYFQAKSETIAMLRELEEAIKE